MRISIFVLEKRAQWSDFWDTSYVDIAKGRGYRITPDKPSTCSVTKLYNNLLLYKITVTIPKSF